MLTLHPHSLLGGPQRSPHRSNPGGENQFACDWINRSYELKQSDWIYNTHNQSGLIRFLMKINKTPCCTKGVKFLLNKKKGEGRMAFHLIWISGVIPLHCSRLESESFAPQSVWHQSGSSHSQPWVHPRVQSHLQRQMSQIFNWAAASIGDNSNTVNVK